MLSSGDPSLFVEVEFFVQAPMPRAHKAQPMSNREGGFARAEESMTKSMHLAKENPTLPKASGNTPLTCRGPSGTRQGGRS